MRLIATQKLHRKENVVQEPMISGAIVAFPSFFHKKNGISVFIQM
jgi:hypothetical protein